MARLPAGAHEVAGDERLPVAGRQRVHRAPERRDQQREQDHAEREIAALDQRLEAAAAWAGAAPTVDAAAAPRAVPGT